MNSINDSIKYLKGVGEKRSKHFEKLGVQTINDLLYFFPRSYMDYTSPIDIKDCVIGQHNIISGKITAKLPVAYIRKGMVIYKAVMTDFENDITIVIYNSEYLFKQLDIGKSYVLSGKVTGSETRMEISSPMIISANSEDKIQPQYHLTEGLSQKMLGITVKNALLYLDKEIYEPIPAWILSQNNLCSLSFALYNIHFPKDMESMEIAKKRLVFDELLVLQLGMLLLKGRNRTLVGSNMQDVSINEFYDNLPFTLTDSQLNAIKDCTNDMCGKYPMNRLVQGDVGSGKTAVAAACCFFSYKNGCQSALMAPTEILAQQHFQTLNQFLEPLGVKCCLLTGSLTSKQKKDIKEQIANGEYSIIVGTHALVQQTTVFKNLSLVITDEQHRFGVNQRATLAQKGDNPHKLVMSATPIPRTLALMIYGDLDISALKELPKGRLPIETYAVTGKLRTRAFEFIKKQLDTGRQGYIVCPAIDENENDLKAVTTYYDDIKSGAFKNYKTALLHGKLPAQQKEQVMNDFKEHKIDLLVSTTVIEVGVDVSNATIMLIENSDRFGLSQLHQLRGRVGRGNIQSYCILVTDNVSEDSKKRLKIMSSTTDGFKISEQDLKLRGPGDFFGNKQHGLPDLKIADMANDLEVLKNAQAISKSIIDSDRGLNNPENKGLKMLISKLFSDKYFN